MYAYLYEGGVGGSRIGSAVPGTFYLCKLGVKIQIITSMYIGIGSDLS